MQVFLFRYNHDATPDAVLKYFKGEGVNAYHIRLRCAEYSDTKCFVMRIRSRDDFKKVVRALPEFTGCRWYIPDVPPDRGAKPPSYFNTGRRINGPDLHLIFPVQDMDDPPLAGMEVDASVTPQPDNNTVTNATAAGSNVSTRNTDVTIPSQTASTVTLQTVTTVTTTTAGTTNTASTVTQAKSNVSGITRLDSPHHMRSATVGYEVVKSDH